MILGRKDVFDAFFVEFRLSQKRVIFTPAPSEQPLVLAKT
jgi:hypothetical protein